MSWKGLPLPECKISYFIDVFTDRLKETQNKSSGCRRSISYSSGDKDLPEEWGTLFHRNPAVYQCLVHLYPLACGISLCFLRFSTAVINELICRSVNRMLRKSLAANGSFSLKPFQVTVWMDSAFPYICLGSSSTFNL